jgi:hypothetical protein
MVDIGISVRVILLTALNLYTRARTRSADDLFAFAWNERRKSSKCV